MDKFIEKSKNKFNNNFCYNSLNYITSKNIIQLECIKHSNIFKITPRNHLNTEFGGCKVCDKEYRFNILEKISKDKYGNNYIINKESFINNLNKIKIKCIIHDHNYEILPQKFLEYSGCNKCYIENCKKELIKKSNLKFNNNFDFKDFIYNSSKDKSNLLCIKHNKSILISATEHLKFIYGGCKECNPRFNNRKENDIIVKKKNFRNNITEKKEFIKNEIKLN